MNIKRQSFSEFYKVQVEEVGHPVAGIKSAMRIVIDVWLN